MIKTAMYFILSLLLISCGSNNQALTGGEGSSTEVVIGYVSDNSGRPVKNVIVTLYPQNYNPITDNGVGKLTRTTDENGRYEFEIAEPDTYTIVCEDVGQDTEKRGAITVYTSSDEVDTSFVTHEIVLMVEKVVAVPESLVDTVGSYIYIPGTDYTVPLAEADKTEGFYSFTFDDIPQGDLPTVNYSSSETPEDDVVILEEVQSFDPIWYKVESSGVDALKNIRQITQDSAGGIWIGSDDALFRLENYNQWTQFDTATGELDGGIVDMSADLDNGIWIVDMSDKISYYDGSTWVSYNSLDFNLISGVSSVTALSTDTLWFGNNMNRGPFRYIKSSNTWSSELIPRETHENTVFSLDSQKGKVWTVSPTGCAMYYNDTWTVYTNEDMGFPRVYARFLNILPDGSVWFSGDDGMSHYDGSSWVYYSGASNILQTDYLFEVTHDTEGRIYVGSSKGLASFYGGEWKEHSGDAGTPPTVNEEITSVDIDRDGNIWACGDSGAYVMGPTAEKYSTKQ